MLVLLLTSSSCHWLDWVFWILCAKWYCTYTDLAPVSSWKFTLIPSTSMVLYQPVFTALMSFWFIVPTKYSVSELSVINCVHSLFVCAIGHFLLCPTHLLEVILCVTLPADFTHCWTGSITMLPTTSTTCNDVCVAALDFESSCLQFFFFTACTPCSVSSVISLSCWTETSSTLATSMALSRVKSEPMSISFSRTLADFVPNTILSRTMSSSACP